MEHENPTFAHSAAMDSSATAPAAAAATAPQRVYDWNHWDFSPRAKKIMKLSVVLLILLIISSALIAASVVHIQYNEYGIIYDSNSGKTETVRGSGQHFVGITKKVFRFPVPAINFEFVGTQEETDTSGPSIEVRVDDGQLISIDISFQVQLVLENLMDLYADFRLDYEDAFRVAGSGAILDVASQWSSEQFFFNRTSVEDQMVTTLRSAIAARHAHLLNVQIRQINLPTTLETRLQDIELRKQESRAANELIVLSQEQDETRRQVIEVEAQKEHVAAVVRQETETQRLEILQVETQQREATTQMVEFLEATLAKDLLVFAKQTEELRVGIAANETQAQEETRRAVEEIEAESAAYVSQFASETAALVINAERNASLITEQTNALRANLTIQTELIKAQADQTISLLQAETAATATSLLANAQRQVEEAVATALADVLGVSTYSGEQLVYSQYVNVLRNAGQSSFKKFLEFATPSVLLPNGTQAGLGTAA